MWIGVASMRLGYEDLNDHGELRGDALVSPGRQAGPDRGEAQTPERPRIGEREHVEPPGARRARGRGPVGTSASCRAPKRSTTYWSSCLWNRIDAPHARSGWTSMRPTTRCTVTRRGDFSTGTTAVTVIFVHFLRRTSVECATAQVEPRWCGGQHRGARAHRGAQGAYPHPGRFGILPRVHHEVVRGARHRLRARIGAQSAPGAGKALHTATRRGAIATSPTARANHGAGADA